MALRLIAYLAWRLDRLTTLGFDKTLGVFVILGLGREQGARGSWGSAYCVSILHWARRQKMNNALLQRFVSSATYCSVLVTLGETVAGSSVAPRIGVVHFTTQVCLAQHFVDLHGQQRAGMIVVTNLSLLTSRPSEFQLLFPLGPSEFQKFKS